MPTFSGGVFLNVLTVAPKAGIGIEVDIYASDGVTMLATMENAREVQFQDQRNQVGSGSFKLNRHDAKATSTILQRSNIVRVKLGGVYRFAYIIESITRTVVSKSGQGAEDVVVAGRGVLALIGRGALYPAGWPAAKVNPRTWSAVPFATVLDTAYTEAIGRGCFPSVTRDWSASSDSLSRAWTDVQSPSLNVGTSLLDLAAQGASLGYDIGMSPTLVWHVWNGTQGVDRSAGSLTPVIFRQGKHFGQEDFTDMIVDGPVITNMLVTGNGGLLLEVTDPALAAEPGIGRREGTFDYSLGQTAQDLSNAGNAAIKHLQVDANPLQLTVTHGPSTNNGTITGDYEPYVDYFLGDTITIDAPPIYSLSNYVVEAFTIAQIADSEAYTVTMDLNSVFLDADILMWNKLGGASVGGSAGVSGLSSGGGTSSGALATVSAVQGDQPGYLDSKIAAGRGITTSLTGSLGNQQVSIAMGDITPLAWASGTAYGYGTLVLGSDNHTYVSLTTANTNHNPTTDGGVHWHDITTGGGSSGLTHSFLGHNAIGASWETMVQNQPRLKKITLATDGMVAGLAAYMRNNGTENGQHYRACLYTDNAGTPDQVIFARHNDSGFGIYLHPALSTSPGPGRWVGFSLGMWLTAGSYWVGVDTSDSTNAVDLAYDASGTDVTGNAGGIDILGDNGYETFTTTTKNYSIRASLLS